MMKQSAGAQAEAASDRLADHVGPIRKKAPAGLVQPGERWCPSCQSSLPDFYFTGARCKGCVSRAAHDARVEKVYGITGEEYEKILKLQGGRCFICGNKPGRKRLAVDHDHKTGEVRGLLCRICNFDTIGKAKDDPDRLRRAADYIENPPVRTYRLGGLL